jgi:hypothetical protein
MTCIFLPSLVTFRTDNPHLSVSGDGRLVAYGSASVSVRDLKSGTLVFSNALHQGVISSDKDLARLTGEPVGDDSDRITSNIWIRLNLCIENLDFCDSSKKLVCVNRSGELRIWETKAWKLLVDTKITQPRYLERVLQSESGHP